MAKFRLDRNAFKAQTAHEAANHAIYYKNKHWTERLAIATYLNSVAYNYPIDSPPHLDRTRFSARGRN